jgi:hypothetical protein
MKCTIMNLQLQNHFSILCWNRNRGAVPARQATLPGDIGFLKSILGLLKSLKILALHIASC